MRKIIFIFALCFAPYSVFGASCHVPNLIRCLDSACVAEASMEPGARCAQCYSVEAQAIVNQRSAFQFGSRSRTQMRALGRPSATSLDLTDAPDDPAERYQWAAAECMKLLPGCTPADVSRHYDDLIEQSCIAAGAQATIVRTMREAEAARKTEDACNTDITICLMADAGCARDWARCTVDADFDRIFASCISSTECGHLTNLTQIKANAQRTRDDYFAARSANLEALVAQHSAARQAELDRVVQECRDGTVKQACIATFCSSMPNQCRDGRVETQWATNMCRFADLACDRILNQVGRR